MQEIPGIDKSEPYMYGRSGAASAAHADTDVARYYVFVDQVLVRGMMQGVSEFLTDDFVEHGIGGDRGREEFLSCVRVQREQHPDAVRTIELLMAVNGLVLCHTTVTRPQQPVATIYTWESVVVRFYAGKIAECWRMRDEGLLTHGSQARS